MNKIFKIIWNHSTQTFNVVSELARSCGKSKSLTDKRKSSKALVALGTVLGVSVFIDSSFIVSSAYANNTAAEPISGRQFVRSYTQDGNIGPTNALHIGPNSNISNGSGQGERIYVNATAVGANSVSRAWSTALGSSAKSTGSFSTAIGYNANTASNYATAVGQSSSVSGDGGASFGSNATAGAEATAIGFKTNASNKYATALGSYSRTSGEKASALGFNASAGERATAVGQSSNAAGVASFAGGADATSGGSESVAVGQSANSGGASSVAVGHSSSSSGTNAVAIGKSSSANQNHAVALGDTSVTSGQKATALGFNTKAGERATAVGQSSNAAGTASFAGGADAVSAGEESVAIGQSANVTASAAQSVAIGKNATATHANSVALGNGSTTATGVNTSSAKINDLTYTGFQGATAHGVVSIGSAGKERQLKNVAAGQITAGSTDAINGSQLYQVIRQAHWKVQADKIAGGAVSGSKAQVVHFGDTVKFIAGNGLNIAQNNQNFTISVNTAALTPNNSGAINTPSNTPNGGDAGKLVNASTVANAINQSGHKVASKDSDEALATSTVNTNGALVKPGDKQTFTAGKNLEVKQSGANLTFALSNDINVNTVNATTINVPTGGNNKVVINNNGINAGNKKITNVANGTNANDAVNLSQLNATKVDVAAGSNIVAVTPSANRTTGGTTYTVHAKGADVTSSSNFLTVTNSTVANNVTLHTLGLKTSNIPTTTTSGIIGKPTADGLVTANNVVDAINNVSWFVDSGKTTGSNEGSTLTNQRVQAGNTVKFIAGDNINIAQNGWDFTISSRPRSVLMNFQNDNQPITNGNNVNADGLTFNFKDGIKGEVNGNTVTVSLDKDTLAKDPRFKGPKGEKGETGERGPAGANGKNGTNGAPGKDGAPGRDGVSPTVTVTNDGNGNHTVTITDSTGSKDFIVKDGEKGEKGDTGANGAPGPKGEDGADGQDGKTPTISVTDGNDGTHTITINDGNGKETKTIVRDGADGRTTGHKLATDKTEDQVTEKTVPDGVTVNPDDKITYKAGKNLVVNQDNQNITFGLAKDINVGTVNATTVNTSTINVPTADGNKVTIDNNGINAGNKPITNVANGVNATDAVNLSQLNATKVHVAPGSNIADVTSEANATTGGTTYTVHANGTKVAVAGDLLSLGTDPASATNGNMTTYTVTLNKGTLTANENTGAVNTVTEENKVATTKAVADTIAKSGWKLDGKDATDNTIANTIINPGDSVKFIDGSGTKAVIDVSTANAPTVKYDIKLADNSLKVDGNGLSANTTTLAEDTAKPGTIAIPANGGNLVNASTVATAINSVSWALHNTTGKVDDVKAGDSVKFIAGNSGLTTVTVSNTGDTANTITVDVTKGNFGTLPNANSPSSTNTGALSAIANGNGSEGVATVSAVTNAINSAFWRVKLAGNGGTEEAVKAGDLVEFAAGDNVEIVQAGKKFTISAKQADVSTADLTVSNNGNITTPVTDGNKLVNATTVANAINESGHNIAIDNSDKQVEAGTDKADKLIKSGEKVTYKAGKNLVVRRDDAAITFGLAKDIDVGTVNASTVNATTINVPTDGNNKVTINNEGINAGGKKITNVAKGTDDNDAVNVKQLRDEIGNNAYSFSVSANTDAVDAIAKNENVKFVNGKNITVTYNATNNTFTHKLNDEITVNKVTSNDIVVPGENTATTSAVAISRDGDAGKITLNGADNSKAEIKVEKAKPNLDNTQTDGKNDRIVYKDSENKKQEVATMNDGLIFTGNNADAKSNKHKLNSKVKVVGERKDAKTSYTEAESAANNIIVEADGTDTLTVKLAKDLTNLASVTTTDAAGNTTVVNGNGITITPKTPAAGKSAVSLTTTGLNNGGNAIINVAGNFDGANGNTAPTTESTTKPTAVNNAATVGDVLNAGWNLKENGTAKDFVRHADTVNFVDGTGTTVAINVAGNTSTVTFDIDNGTMEAQDDGKVQGYDPEALKTATTELETAKTTLDKAKEKLANANAGNDDLAKEAAQKEVEAAQKAVDEKQAAVNKINNKVATVENVVKAINESGFTLTAQGKNGSVVSPGETVDMKNTDGNIEISKSADNNDVIYNLAKDINVDSVQLGEDGPKVQKGADGSIKVGDKDGSAVAITNVAGNLPGAKKDGNSFDVAPKTARTEPENVADIYNNAATVGDVLNAGWNLQGNGKAKDFVKSYDTVNFVDGEGTTATVITKPDGKSSDIVYSVNVDGKTTEITYTNAAGETVYKLADGTYNTQKDGKGTVIDPKTITGSRVSAILPTTSVGGKQVGGDVNFANGNGTTLTVEEGKDGKPNTIKVNVDTAKINATPNGNVEGPTKALTDKVKEAEKAVADANQAVVNAEKAKADADQAVVDAQKALDDNKDTDKAEALQKALDEAKAKANDPALTQAINKARAEAAKPELAEAVKKAKDELAKSPEANKLATAQNVADAINNSGHKVATADTDEELATSTVDADGTLVKPGDKQTFTAGKNLEVKQDGANVTFAVSNDLDVGSVNVGEKGEPGKDGQPGKPGKDGKVAVNGKDGSSVVINGKDGSIGLTGPKGKDGKDGVSANIKLGVGEPGVDGKDGVPGLEGADGKPQKPRIEYSYDNKGKTIVEKVATLKDGLIFDGDVGEEVKRPLNTKLTVKGGQTDKTKLSDKKNIGVVSNPTDNSLEVKLAKDIDLTKDGSITIGDTIVNNDGMTIKDGPSITKSGIDAGNTTISNVKEGVKGTDAVNVNQLNRKMGDVNNRINKVNKDLQAGIAGATAMAFLQRPNLPGKSMVSAAVGGYKGQSAIAVGYARNSDNNKISIKVGVGLNSRKDVTYGGSVGYQW